MRLDASIEGGKGNPEAVAVLKGQIRELRDSIAARRAREGKSIGAFTASKRSPAMQSTTKPGAKRGSQIRRWARIIHRDLSYFFAGVVVVYAVSGIVLNHKRDFNSNYSVRRTELQMPGSYPAPAETSREQAEELLRAADPEARYVKHYASGEQRVKVFRRRGSVLEVDMQNGRAVYEKLTKRPVISSMNRLHYKSPTGGGPVFPTFSPHRCSSSRSRGW